MSSVGWYYCREEVSPLRFAPVETTDKSKVIILSLWSLEDIFAMIEQWEETP